MARRPVHSLDAFGVRGRHRRQTPLDRFDEAVGEDESLLDRIAGIVDMPRAAIVAAIQNEDERGSQQYVDDRERISPGSFNMDPGMRAPDEFSDVTSEGYNEWAKRAAERGGAKEYATSVEEEEADAGSAERRKQMLFALAALIGGGAMGKGANRMLGPGPRPGLGVGGRNPTQAEWNAMKEARIGPVGGIHPEFMEAIKRDPKLLDRLSRTGEFWRPGTGVGGFQGPMVVGPMVVDPVSPSLDYRAFKGRGK